MYVARVDAKILTSDEVLTLKRKYREKFGEFFIPFNYADFPGTETQHAAEMYKEILEKAVQDNKPYHIVSHRYDEIDH